MDRNTPIPPVKRKRLEDRVADVETAIGKIMAELGKIWDIIGGDRNSEVNASFHPTKARISFKNSNPWVIVAGLLVVALIVWILRR